MMVIKKIYRLCRQIYRCVIKEKLKSSKRKYKTINKIGKVRKEKLYVIRRYQTRKEQSGFFSNFFFVLGHIKYAKEHNYTCVVDMENYETCYSQKNPINGTKNVWEYYFYQPMGMSLEEVYKSNKYTLSDDRYKYEYMPTATKGGREKLNPELVSELSELISKYIKIKEDILEKVEKIWNVVNGNDDKILGVHIRGTDMKNSVGHPKPLGVECYIKKIHELLEGGRYTKILLCTDEEILAESIKNEFEELVFQTDAYHSNDGQAVHTTRKKNERENHRYLMGLEVLIDTILLSKTDALLCGYSNVSMAAIIFNNNCYEAVYYLVDE